MLLAVLVAACAAGFPASGEAARPSSREVARPSSVGSSQLVRSWERYREIADLNIFSPNRRPRRRSSNISSEAEQEALKRLLEKKSNPAADPEPGDEFSLRGVSLIGDTYYAFFENTDDSSSIHASVGDTVGKRKLTRITLDQVQYEDAGKTITIVVGKTLTGKEAPVARSEPAEEKTSGESSSSESSGAEGSKSEKSSGGSSEAGEKSSGGESALERLLRRRREQISR